MSSTSSGNNSVSSSPGSKKSGGRRQSRYKKSLSRVIIRHLPPNLTEDTFKETLDLPTSANTHWYLAGAVSADLGYFATSRAYVTFTRMDDLILFKDKYDGYVFVDSKGGGEYRAQVDLAPSQRVPKGKKGSRKDGKVGTLDKDTDYLKFVESLSAPKSESNVNTAESYLEEIETRDRELKLSNGCPKITTPLIEFVLKKKSDRLRKKYDDRPHEDKHRRNKNRNHLSKSDRTKGHKKQIQNDNQDQKLSHDSNIPKAGQSKPRDQKDRFKSFKKASQQVTEQVPVVLSKPSTVERAGVGEDSAKKVDTKPREQKNRGDRGPRPPRKPSQRSKNEQGSIEKKPASSIAPNVEGESHKLPGESGEVKGRQDRTNEGDKKPANRRVRHFRSKRNNSSGNDNNNNNSSNKNNKST